MTKQFFTAAFALVFTAGAAIATDAAAQETEFDAAAVSAQVEAMTFDVSARLSLELDAPDTVEAQIATLNDDAEPARLADAEDEAPVMVAMAETQAR